MRHFHETRRFWPVVNAANFCTLSANNQSCSNWCPLLLTFWLLSASACWSVCMRACDMRYARARYAGHVYFISTCAVLSLCARVHDGKAKEKAMAGGEHEGSCGLCTEWTWLVWGCQIIQCSSRNVKTKNKRQSEYGMQARALDHLDQRWRKVLSGLCNRNGWSGIWVDQWGLDANSLRQSWEIWAPPPFSWWHGRTWMAGSLQAASPGTIPPHSSSTFIIIVELLQQVRLLLMTFLLNWAPSMVG